MTTDDVLSRLESLAWIYHRNRRLLRLLERANRDADRAREYLGRPGCNRLLGSARLAQVRRRRHAVLRQLEANWRTIRGLSTLDSLE